MSGLYGKYRVERTDGEVKPNARYFVLNYFHDDAAWYAAMHYALRVVGTKPDLADGLIGDLNRARPDLAGRAGSLSAL